MSERPYSQGRIAKLKRAKRLALAAEKALRAAGIDIYADGIKEMIPGIDHEQRKCEFWAIENSRPYYGG